MSAERFQLADLTWEAFRDRVPSRTDLVLIPVGTLEAHGAIPLGTDNRRNSDHNRRVLANSQPGSCGKRRGGGRRRYQRIAGALHPTGVIAPRRATQVRKKKPASRPGKIRDLAHETL